MEKLKKESKRGSRQNKIISLLMNNQDYNLRVQNVHHSDKLNALLDNEYMMPMYYNTLYEQVDKLLTGGEEFGYGSDPTDSQNTEENEDFSEVDLDDSDEVFNSIEKYKNLPKEMQNTLQNLKKGMSFIRKPLVTKFSNKDSNNKKNNTTWRRK